MNYFSSAFCEVRKCCLKPKFIKPYFGDTKLTSNAALLRDQ